MEQEELAQLLEHLTARVRSGGLVVKDMFKDFDANNAYAHPNLCCSVCC